MSNSPKFGVAIAERPDLADLERAIPDLADIPPDAVPEALARVAHLQSRLAALGAGLVALVLAQATARPAQSEPDRLLSVEEAAQVLGVSEDWVYKHKRELPAVRNGRRLLFSAMRLQRYVSGRLRGSMPLERQGK